VRIYKKSFPPLSTTKIKRLRYVKYWYQKGKNLSAKGLNGYHPTQSILSCDWYWIRTDRACGGVGVIEGIVRAAYPYFRFMIGKRLTEIPQIREWHRI